MSKSPAIAPMSPRVQKSEKGLPHSSSKYFKSIQKFSGRSYVREVAFEKALEALELATAAGAPSRLVLEVDAFGQTSISLEVVRSRVIPAEVETLGELNAELRVALDAAKERGRASAAEILAGGDMLSADDFGKMLGTTPCDDQHETAKVRASRT